jgi:hypothetical protein
MESIFYNSIREIARRFFLAPAYMEYALHLAGPYFTGVQYEININSFSDALVFFSDSSFS